VFASGLVSPGSAFDALAAVIWADAHLLGRVILAKTEGVCAIALEGATLDATLSDFGVFALARFDGNRAL
jgi:hypothetical protein